MQMKINFALAEWKSNEKLHILQFFGANTEL